MTILPRPVTRDKYGKRTKDYTQRDWYQQLSEELGEVATAHTREQKAEELTDLKTVCESYLNALGYDEDDRAELQRKVNEKNFSRGYFEE